MMGWRLCCRYCYANVSFCFVYDPRAYFLTRNCTGTLVTTVGFYIVRVSKVDLASMATSRLYYYNKHNTQSSESSETMIL